MRSKCPGGWVGGVVPLVEVALDIGWEDTGYRRAALATEWVPLKRSRMRIGWDWENGVGGCQPRRVRGRAHRAW
jgi:hypothetical protein